ncbi:alpha-L-fucosidase [Neobacillus mesonae]|nr:alpha-L-fucosidase [Neobacillus mesonae]
MFKSRLFKMIALLGVMFMTIVSTFSNIASADAANEENKGNLKGIPGTIEYNSNEDIAAWQRLQYGMFIHWGLYSELGGVYKEKPVTRGYSEQIQMWANIPEEEYLKVANQFKAENFNPKEICSLAKDAGMKYVVITSKHHDGFSMFDTATTDYNIVDSTPYGKDPLKELANACRDQGLKFGVYFSLVDWHQGHPFDNNNNNSIPESMEPTIEKQIRELMTNYGPIAEVWFDMSSPTQAQSSKFAGIVRELQPHAVINSRIFNNQGDFRTLGDNQVPASTLDGAWQTPASIYHSTWGYRSWQVRDNFDGKVRDLVTGLTSVTARGGNYLLNIGPRGDGSVVGFEADVLRAIGSWLDRHPGAVLGASATRFGKQPWGEVTVNNHDLFLHVINWPQSGELKLSGLATRALNVQEDGNTSELQWKQEGNDLVITLPNKPTDAILPVIKVKLAGDLRIIPEKTLTNENDGTWNINPADLYLGRSYADRGSYYTTKQTTVRQTAYIASHKGGQVYLEFDGKANANEKYQIEIGNHSYVVSGEELTNSSIGPFTVPANEVTTFTITLAEPAYPTKDLELEFKSAHIVSKNPNKFNSPKE